MQASKWIKWLAALLPAKLVEALRPGPSDEVAVIAAAKDKAAPESGDRRKDALARRKARHWRSPPDYRFDRDEASER
jgi:antitoxin MazE